MSFCSVVVIYRLKVTVQLKPAHLDGLWPAGTSEAHTIAPVWHSPEMTEKKKSRKI